VAGVTGTAKEGMAAAEAALAVGEEGEADLGSGLVAAVAAAARGSETETVEYNRSAGLHVR